MVFKPDFQILTITGKEKRGDGENIVVDAVVCRSACGFGGDSAADRRDPGEKPEVTVMELLLAAELHCLEESVIGVVCEKLAELGIGKLVLSSVTYERELREPGYLAKVHCQVAKAGLEFASAHGLWSANNDLNWPDRAGRLETVKTQACYLKRAAAAGCRTFILHPGAAFIRYSEAELWDCVRESVELLLPEAEKNRIILALENNIAGFLGDDCQRLADFIRSFDSEWVGASFDCGCANISGDLTANFAALKELTVTAVLHDNNGSANSHLVPGQGTVDWKLLLNELTGAPRLIHCETDFSGSHDLRKVLPALDIYRNLPGITF